jgi:hypothetical protein
MLDDVEARRLLVEPAGEDAAESALALGHVDLDEGAGQLLLLVRRRRLAGAQANDQVLEAPRLARPHAELAADPVPLVEDADDGDPLGHRRGARRDLGHGLRDLDDLGLRLDIVLLNLALRRAGRPAGGDGEERRRGRYAGEPRHGQSGVQAS